MLFTFESGSNGAWYWLQKWYADAKVKAAKIWIRNYNVPSLINGFLVFGSAAKAPYLARFRVRKCGIKELEKLALSVSDNENGSGSPEAIDAICKPSPSDVWQAAIFKVCNYWKSDSMPMELFTVWHLKFYSLNCCFIFIRKWET